MQVTETAAANVRAELARKGLSQTQASVKLGISKQAMSSKLNSKTAFTLAELGKLSQWLEVDIREFFRESQPLATAA